MAPCRELIPRLRTVYRSFRRPLQIGWKILEVAGPASKASNGTCTPTGLFARVAASSRRNFAAELIAKLVVEW
jgi:hypothetical protein